MTMQTARTINEIREIIKEQRKSGKKIGFVPTMGYLHEGHLSLVDISQKHSDYQVMSIFVNKIQFNDSKDYANYPREIQRDLDLAKSAGVDLVFIPDDKENIQVSRSLADYVWGLPEEGKPAFPSVGLRFKMFDGLENLVIERKPIDGVAKGANFEKGDVILSVDGKRFSDINVLRVYLAKFSWGDQVSFCILRNAQEIEMVLKFEQVENEAEKQ